jgi:maltooligosyltrehalose trehalohydrolase
MKVWAPLANRVELACNDRLSAMKREKGGWWIADAPYIQHGVDYAYRIDGRGPFPDPRSPWQPAGVHGPSRRLDHREFAWSDSSWRPPPLNSAIIYELHVGTFSREGTFDGVIGHLDDLVDLGITHVELMPVVEFSGSRGWGYDGVDLYAPHHAYGGPEGLKRLVDSCHRRGLAVVLDVVYNHLGPEGSYISRFGPYFTDRHATPWGNAVNLDGEESDEVRRFFIDNALMWLRDYHFDGLRLDAVHAFLDLSALHFLEQLAAEVERLAVEIGRHLVLIAESDLNDPRVVRTPEVGGYGMDAQWNEDFHHALHTVLTGERDGYYRDFGDVADLAKALSRVFVLDGGYSIHRGRSHGRATGGLSGNRFVACLQNHDQVGNRALGERSGQLLPPGLLKVGAALVITSPFIPLLFQGEEWAASTPFLYFTDHQDEELGEAVRQGRRQEFSDFVREEETIPDPQAETTFLRSKIKREESREQPHLEMLNWYRDLIALRRRMPALQDGRLEHVSVCFDESARWLVMKRHDIVVACNFSTSAQKIRCRAAELKIVLASTQEISVKDGGISLPPESAAVLLQEKVLK